MGCGAEGARCLLPLAHLCLPRLPLVALGFAPLGCPLVAGGLLVAAFGAHGITILPLTHRTKSRSPGLTLRAGHAAI